MNSIEFSFCVPFNHPSLSGHFPGNSIVPGVLLLDYVFYELTKRAAKCVKSLGQVRFKAALLPNELAFVGCELDDDKCVFQVSAKRNGINIIVASGSVSLQLTGNIAT